MTSVFNGETTDWSALGEESRPIALYLLDDNSGTFGVLKTTLGGRPSASAKRFVKNEELADAVAADPNGLGFVAASSVRRARAVPVLTPEGMAIYATPLTMVTESYPLTRRLYLYTPERSTNALAADFVRFATSSDGQKVVRATGFVDLNIMVQDWDPCAATPCPGRYAGIVKRARRLSVDFRFRPGTVELDGREADVDRLVTFLRDNPGRIALMGFSDVGVDRDARIQDSIACAKSVRDELRARGVEPAAVDGFGEALPIAARSDARHAVRNRRVEVWRIEDGSNNGSARDALHGSK
jgi:phosphate transport system substrate-binding protein